MHKKHYFPLMMLSLILLAANGCALWDVYFIPEPAGSPEELFEAGNDAIRDKDYVVAAEYFSKLKELFPFSPYALEADLSLADCYYLDEEFLLAAETYKEFESMHPRHSAIPYVLYQIGISHMHAYISVDRPPTVVHEAYAYFLRVRDSFPGTEYAFKASEKMKDCRKLLAEHEIYMGNFYFRVEHYGAAWRRYKSVVEYYPDVVDLHEYASDKVNAAYLLYRQNQTESERRERESTWHKLWNWL